MLEDLRNRNKVVWRVSKVWRWAVGIKTFSFVYVQVGSAAFFRSRGRGMPCEAISMLQPIHVTDVRLNSAAPFSKENRPYKEKKRVQFTPASSFPAPPLPVHLNRTSSLHGRRTGSKEAEKRDSTCYSDPEDWKTPKNECFDLATCRT